MARRKKRISHKKELYYILCIVAVLGVLALSLAGPGGYGDLRKARLELQEQRARVQGLKQTNSAIMESIENLQSSREALEDFARRNGYAKENEIIQQIPPEPEKSE